MHRIESPFQFVVFGCRPTDESLIELHTDSFNDAVVMHSLYSCDGYKARVFDNEKQQFINPAVIDHAVQFLLT